MYERHFGWPKKRAARHARTPMENRPRVRLDIDVHNVGKAKLVLKYPLYLRTKLRNRRLTGIVVDPRRVVSRALDVISKYTCSLYHIVIHCLLTDNTATTSHCKLKRACKRVFVQLSLKEEAKALSSREVTRSHSDILRTVRTNFRGWGEILKTNLFLVIKYLTNTNIKIRIKIKQLSCC